MASVIELCGVHKFFPGVHALKNVDFSVERGEVHALVGELDVLGVGGGGALLLLTPGVDMRWSSPR